MKRLITFLVCFAGGVLLTASNSVAQALPKISIDIGQTTEPSELSSTLQIILLITILALAPSIVIMVTSFIRFVVVLSFLRHALGVQQLPPNQLILALSLLLTFFVMSPVIDKAYTEGIKPYMEEKITQEEAFEIATAPVREFMLSQTREKDLALFVNIAKLDKPDSPADIP
ncbi:MAG: flagellar biosynthetic protein FliP, partial [candidate division Zixibacteria bacterium]